MIKKKNISSLFTLFLTLHLVLWTLVPSISNNNLPLDTIEHLAWGSNLDWGFNKHPPFVAFALEFFYQIFGSQDWAYYLLSQIFVIFSFYVVYKFSEDFFQEKIYAFISVLLLEGIYFYNFTTPEFNVNVCQLPFWALSVLYCWKGFKENKILDWLLFGLFAALGILSKYLFVYLLIAIDVFFLYMFFKKKINFKCFASLITFILVLLPHLIWLTENEYITITYGLHRTGTGDQVFLDHLSHPFIFLAKQIGILVPLFIMLFFVLSKIKVKFNTQDKRLLFLTTVSIIPIILMFLTSMIMGVKIRTMWMTPFYLFTGVFFVYLFKNKINLKKINQFIVSFLIFFILSPAIYLYVSFSQTNKRTDYPGKEIARLVQTKWDKNFSNEISIIVGDEWSGGNLSYHLYSRPKWFNNLDNIEDINIEGGVIYTGNPGILKKICPGVYGTIRPIGICMIGAK